MDHVPGMGRDIPSTMKPVFSIFGGMLRQPEAAAKIRATKRETFQYGPKERHALDYYTPSASAPHPSGSGPRPVILYLYGGGFVRGERIDPGIEGELVYKNVGHFCAEKLGYDTIVMDYSLVKHGAAYPSGARELDMALNWIEKQSPEKRDVYLLLGSAGAVQVATWLFDNEFQQSVEARVTGKGNIVLKAAAFIGCPIIWDEKTVKHSMLAGALVAYYGSEENAMKHSVLDMMKRAVNDPNRSKVWPPILIAVGEYEPEHENIAMGKVFADTWKAAGQKGDYWILKGQNHLSPILSLGTGSEREEKWGYDVGGWFGEQK